MEKEDICDKSANAFRIRTEKSTRDKGKILCKDDINNTR